MPTQPQPLTDPTIEAHVRRNDDRIEIQLQSFYETPQPRHPEDVNVTLGFTVPGHLTRKQKKRIWERLAVLLNTFLPSADKDKILAQLDNAEELIRQARTTN